MINVKWTDNVRNDKILTKIGVEKAAESKETEKMCIRDRHRVSRPTIPGFINSVSHSLIAI